MKHHWILSAVLAVSSLLATAQEEAKDKAVISAASVDATNDWLMLGDASTTAGQPVLRRLKIDQAVAVPSFFTNLPNGSFALNKLAQSAATTGQVATWNGTAWAPANASGGGVIDITAEPYNAVADGRINDGAVMTSGSAALTCATGQFQTTDVGKFIRVVGAGTAGTSLVTTIAARASATSITLAANAATSVTSAQVFFGTNNSAAIQAAIDAAHASATTKMVVIPSDKFLCNVVGKATVKIVGAGTLARQSAYNYISLNAETTCTYLLPALDTEPVIMYAQDGEAAGGFVISDINFVGGDGTSSADRFGTAIEVGPPLDSVNGAMSGGWSILRCEINGFNRAVTASRTWDSKIEAVQVNYCNVGFFGGELTSGGVAATTGPADGINVFNCGSNYTDVVFALYGCKQTTVSCGDFNHMQKFAVLKESALIVSGVNLEQVSVVKFHLEGVNSSRLDVAYITGLGWTDFCWNESTSSTHNVSVRLASAGPLVYKTAAATGYPLLLPKSSVIARYTDATFGTLLEKEFADVVYMTDGESAKYKRFNDSFVGSITGAAGTAVGQLGWKSTTITGGFLTRAVSNPPGAMDWYSSSASVGTSARLALQQTICYPNSEYWEIRGLVTITHANVKHRFGLYELETTADMDPTYGVGLLLDPTVSTYAQLEIRNGGTSTLIPTTVLVSSFATAKEVKISRGSTGSGGVFLTISSKGGGAVAPQVSSTASVTSSGCTLALFTEITTGGTWLDIYLYNLDMRFLPSF